MFTEYYKQIKEEAIAAYPEEAVWLITPNECRLVVNKAEDKLNTFKVDKRTLSAAYKRGLLAVVHSHTDAFPCPSASDMKSQMLGSVPWGIISTNGSTTSDVLWFGDQVEKANLVNRSFCHGVTDCYSLIRDFYSIELNIALPEFPRDWEWWNKEQNLYLDGFPKAGFIQLDCEDVKTGKLEPKKGDVWLAMIRSQVPNHGGVYVENEIILHHVTSEHAVDRNRLSSKEPIHRWMPFITHWLRHEDLL